MDDDSGCLTLLIIIAVIWAVLYLATRYWYITITLVAIGLVIYLLFEANEREKKRQADIEKRRQEDIKKEIERRRNIVLDIVNNLYKDTQREVNKTLIPTLINEVDDINTGLHSDNMNDLIINGSLTDFQNIINSIESELNRLKKLALDAQAKGFTDDGNEYTYSNENDNKMTKEKAFELLGIKLTASREEIKKAYRDLVKKYNTDQRIHYEDHIKQMLEDKMKEINCAKDYLSTLGLL